MPTARIPSYRLHKASQQAVVTLDYRDHYLGPYGSPESRARYEQLVAEWLAHGRRLPTAQEAGTVTVAELMAAYLQFAEGYYRRDGQPTSEYVAVRDALKPVRALYSGIAVRDFGPMCLKTVREELIRRGLARRHINQRTNRIRRCFRWGVENELVPPSVLEGLRAVAPLKKGRTPAPETDPIRPAPMADVEAVLPHVSAQVRAMIQLQLLSGMRPGEVVLLRPCDLDQSGPVWTYQPARHKTDYRDAHRTIFVGPKAQAVLQPFLDRQPEEYCFSPAEAEAERNAARRAARQTKMTPSQGRRVAKAAPARAKRDHYDRDSYRRAIQYAIKKAKCGSWHPHQLRHNCGTRVRSECGLDVAQVVLGHQTCDVSQVYAAADHRKAMQAMELLG